MCLLLLFNRNDLLGFCLQVVLEHFLGLYPLGILCFDLNDQLSAQFLREVLSRGFFGGSEESTVDVRAIDLTAACEQAQCVCMAELLRNVSDVLLSIANVVVAGATVQGIDYVRLLAINL